MSKTLEKFLGQLDHRRAFWIILGISLIPRLIALTMFHDLPFMNDTISYHKIGVDYSNGVGRGFFWPPGLPLYLSLWYFVFGEAQLVGRFAMLFLWMFFAFVLYKFVSNVSSRSAANCSVLFFAFYPNYIYQSVTPLTQLPTATTMILMLMLITSHFKSHNWIKTAAGGFFGGFLTLLRASTSPFTFLVPVYIWIKTRAVFPALSWFIGSALVLGLFLGYAYKHEGRFVAVNDANSINFFRGNNPYTPMYRTWQYGIFEDVARGTPAGYVALRDSILAHPKDERNGIFMRTALTHILDRPDKFIIRSLSRFRCYFTFDTFTGATIIKDYKLGKFFGLCAMGMDMLLYNLIMLLALLFLFGYRFAQPNLEHVLLISAFIVLYASPYFISWANSVYRFPVMPMISVFASSFLVRRFLGDEKPNFGTNKKRWLALCMAALATFQIEIIIRSFGRVF